jgi:hypothetical protein
VEVLETRLAPAGIVNGDFAISNPSDPNYGWTTQGGATIANGQGILNEGTTTQTQLSQSFTIPAGTTTLQFTIVASNLVSNGSNSPPDAFEAALLNASTNQPLVGPPTGLSNTDAFLNIQETGQVFYAPQVTVPGAGASGATATLSYPELVTVDLSSVPANTQATIYFNLIGFAPANSTVRITDVTTSAGPSAPPVSFALDPATDSGGKGDNLTNINPVNLLGATDPNQTVSLSIGNDGFTDGTTTADASGHFTFSGVHLAEGANRLRVEATNAQGTTTATQTVTLDTTPPVGTLVVPSAGSTTTSDLGYVEIQWTDSDGGGIDSRTFGTGNVTIPGVAITQVQDLGNDLERYDYTSPSGLPPGKVDVTLVGGQVADEAANVNAPSVPSFTYEPAPAAINQSIITAEGTPYALTLSGTDFNTPPLPLTYTVTTAPVHGTLTGTAPKLTYTPAAGYFGPDSLQFKVNNGLLDSAVATVTIDVVGTPTAQDQTVTTAEDTPHAVVLAGTDPNTPPRMLTFTVEVSPSHGALSGTIPNLVYTPAAGYIGPDTIRFTVKNGVASSNVAAVTIDVVGHPTAVTPPVVTVPQDHPTPITLTATDPDTPPRPLTYTITTRPKQGTLSGSAPTLTYTPAPGYLGPDAFQFLAGNGVVDSTPAIVTIDVVGPPVAQAQSVTVGQGTATPIILTGSDPNVPARPLIYLVTAGPAHGRLSGSAPNLTYTPDASYVGPDSFQFKVSNGVLASPVATVAIVVAPGASPVVANDSTFTTVENRPLVVAAPGVLAGAVSPQGAPTPSVVLVTGPAHGQLALNPNGSFAYTPYANFIGSDQFTFQAFAGNLAGNVATVRLTVTPLPVHLLPNTPYFNYVRRRRSINPPRFSVYHPRVSTFIGLEQNGLPSAPTALVPRNVKFNAPALRASYRSNPASFQARQPVLGALFQLETVGNAPAPTHLLPVSPHFAALRAQYEQNPTRFHQTHVYLAAVLALEDIERGG